MYATQIQLHGFQTLIRVEKRSHRTSRLNERWLEFKALFMHRFLSGFPTAWGGPGRPVGL